MTDESGAVDTAPEVIAEPIVETPNPISVDNTNPDPAPDVKPEPKSTRDALKDAAEKVGKDDAPDKAETKAKPDDKKAEKPAEPVKDEKKPAERDETGKFKAQEGVNQGAEDAKADTDAPKPADKDTGHHEAPARFSPDAKTAWADAPESVRAEATRAVRELESGIEEYRQRFEPLKPYEEMAKNNGTDIVSAMENYSAIDAMLHKDPIKGLETVCQTLGFSLNDVVAQMSGKPADQNVRHLEGQLRQAHSEIQRLSGQLGQHQQQAQRQTETAVQREVDAFKADPAHARFAELEPKMAKLLTTGLADTLSEAYSMAERLNPGPSQAPTPAVAEAAAPDLSAQTQKGSKSITGAPGTGSNPAARPPSTSIKESLKRAMSATAG